MKDLSSSDAGEYFDGIADDADRLVMERARKQIEEVRKTDAVLCLLDMAGAPLQGTCEIRLIRHAFPFGAALSHAHLLGPDDDAYPGKEAGLQAAADLFTMATVNCHWGETQRSKDGPPDWSWTDLFLEWAERHGMHSRLHALLYMNQSYTPPWYREVTSTDAWWPWIERRIAAVADRYGTRIHEYDVINEMWQHNPWRRANIPLFPELSDPANALRVFEIARRHLPDATLIPLESFIPTLYEGNGIFHSYYGYCKRLIEMGAPLDAVGYQGHFYTDRPSFRDGNDSGGPYAFRMGAISEGLDHLATLGKPIHITEFNPPSRNAREPHWPARLSDDAVAAWTVNYYTLAFSKPYIAELVRWFVVDAVGGRGTDAGLVTRAGEIKPAYRALKTLLQETWTTRQASQIEVGEARFRGFFGTYTVEVSGCKAATFELLPGGECTFTIRLKRSGTE